METQQQNSRSPVRSRPKSRTGGFTIAEVALALVVLAMMTMMFAAVFPIAVRGAQYSSDYAQASLLAQHKMEQFRSAGYAKTVSPATLQSLQIIDGTTANADGSYSFTSVDNLDSTGTTHGYFPSGGTGTVTITDYNAILNSVPSGTMAYVTVKIKWSGSGASNGNYTLSTIISKAALP